MTNVKRASSTMRPYREVKFFNNGMTFIMFGIWLYGQTNDFKHLCVGLAISKVFKLSKVLILINK